MNLSLRFPEDEIAEIASRYQYGISERKSPVSC